LKNQQLAIKDFGICCCWTLAAVQGLEAGLQGLEEQLKIFFPFLNAMATLIPFAIKRGGPCS